jgi:hypothetical protein
VGRSGESRPPGMLVPHHSPRPDRDAEAARRRGSERAMTMPSRVAHSSAHIVAVGSVDDHGQGNASSISQETALGAFLPAIGRIGERKRIFPEELLSLLHLQLATPTGFLPAHHTPVVPPATISGRSLSAPIVFQRSWTVELAPSARGSAFHPDTSS